MKRITGISTLVAATLLAMSLGACSRHGSESRQPSMQATGAEVQAVRGDARSSLEDARQELSEAMQELDKAQRNLAQTVTEEARQDAKDAVQEAMSKIEDANEKLDEALRERGEGVLLATAHVGPWDAAAQGLRGTRQEPILLVMGQEQDAAAGTFHDLVRRTAGLEVRRVGAHPLDALPVLEWLQAGKVAAVQMDRAPKEGAIVVDLLGAPFPLPKGPFALASVAQVALLPVFASRRGFFDYRIDVGHPIRLPRRADREQVEGAAGAFAAQMGAFLRSNATQWFHFTDDALAADVDLDE